MEQKYPGLEIDEDMNFHKVEWMLQRAGRVLMFAFLTAAALGLFGAGILSKQEVRGGILYVEYDRFCRNGKNAAFEIRLGPAEATAGRTERKLWVSGQFLRNVKIEHIQPEPSSVQAGKDGHSFTFESPGADEPFSVYLRYRPERPGRHSVTMRAGEGAGEVTFEQLVYF